MRDRHIGQRSCHAALVLTLLGPAPARAMEIRYPKAKPLVALDVPKDWRVATTDIGLELAAPGRTSFVVAALVDRSSQAVEAWAKQASAKMREFGVTIDPDAKAPEAKTSDAKPGDAKPGDAKPGDAKPAGLPEPPPPGGTPTVSGDVSPDTLPKQMTAAAPAAGPALDQMLSVAPPAGTLMPKLPFHVVQYIGARLKGRPVDLQLIVYGVSATQDFLVEQMSDANDPRAAKIVTSAKMLGSANAPR